MTQAFTTTSQVRIESVSQLMQVMAYRDHSILSLFINPTPTGSKSDPSVKDPTNHQWINSRLKSSRGYLASDITAAATQFIIKNEYMMLLANRTILTIDDEVMKVTNVEKSDKTYTVTVTRGYLSTTPTAHRSGTLIKAEKIWKEGEDSDDYDFDGGLKDFNVCQIFREQVFITGSAQATKTYNNELSLETQMAQKIPNLLQQIEHALLNPNKPTIVDEKTRVMAGMPYYIHPDMKRTNSGNKFSVNILQNDINELISNGVKANDILLMAGIGVKSSIDDLKMPIVRENTKIRGLDMTLDSLVVSGSHKVNIAQYCPGLGTNEYYLFDRNSVQVKFFRPLAKEKLAKTGDNEKLMAISEATAEFHNWSQGGALRRTDIA